MAESSDNSDQQQTNPALTKLIIKTSKEKEIIEIPHNASVKEVIMLCFFIFIFSFKTAFSFTFLILLTF